MQDVDRDWIKVSYPSTLIRSQKRSMTRYFRLGEVLLEVGRTYHAHYSNFESEASILSRAPPAWGPGRGREKGLGFGFRGRCSGFTPN